MEVLPRAWEASWPAKTEGGGVVSFCTFLSRISSLRAVIKTRDGTLEFLKGNIPRFVGVVLVMGEL